MRATIIIVIVALVGIAAGSASAWYAIQRSQGFGAIEIGAWTAIPYASAGDVDPYTVAKSVVEGSVPLGVAEGLAFNAISDSAGRDLSLSCDYVIAGTTPAAKLWTLVAYGPGAEQIKPSPGGASAIYSGSVVRFANGSYRISLSKLPKPGNWLAISGDGAFRLTLRLYDTAISGSGKLGGLNMPSIVRGACAS